MAIKAATFEHYKNTGIYGPYMLVLNGLYTAFRSEDLLAFRWSTYEITKTKEGVTGVIKFQEESKTGKFREVPMSPTYLSSVRYMMAQLGLPKDEYVHKSTYPAAVGADRITYFTANRWLKRWAKHCGIKQTVTTHTLRKTWALRVYRLLGSSEEALMKVSTALNHNDAAETRTYIGLSRNSETINKLYMIL